MRETKNIMAGSSSQSKLHSTSTIYTQINLAKLICSEKATKFCEISTVDLTV